MKPLSMTNDRWGTLALALGAGLAAALLAYLLVRGRVEAAGSSLKNIPVVVAGADIPARTRLTDAMLRMSLVPPSQASPDFVGARTELVGKVVMTAIPAGRPITREEVAAPDSNLGMAFALPPGRRAVTIPLDAAEGVGGFARPGDHVDILATTDSDSGSQSETRTVLQNVLLLAVGSRTDADAAPDAGTASHDPEASTVTVAVSPPEAQALVLWADRGKLHLALRPADDLSQPALPLLHSFPAAKAPAPSAHTYHHPAPPSVPPLPVLAAVPLPVSAPAPLPSRITVIRGNQMQTVTVNP